MNLDDSLDEWAALVALPEAAAEDVFRRIVATPVPRAAPVPGVDPRWWTRFSAQLATTIVVSSRAAGVPRYA